MRIISYYVKVFPFKLILIYEKNIFYGEIYLIESQYNI